MSTKLIKKDTDAGGHTRYTPEEVSKDPQELNSQTRSMGIGGDEDWTAYSSGTWATFWDGANGRQYIGRVSGGATSGYLRRSFKCPADVNGTPASGVSIDTRVNSNAGSMFMTVFVNGTPDANMNSVDIEPSTTDTWETKQFTFDTAPSPGDEVSVAVEVTSTGAAQSHDVNMFQINYDD